MPVTFRECARCGGCCTPAYHFKNMGGGKGVFCSIVMSRKELDRIAAHLGMTVQETVKKYDLTVNGDCVTVDLYKRARKRKFWQKWFPKKYPEATVDRPCTFMDTKDNNRCIVHDVKPLNCLDWPTVSMRYDESKQKNVASQCRCATYVEPDVASGKPIPD
jgi:hypothetical protein